MDPEAFDDFTRIFAGGISRRQSLKLLGSLFLGFFLSLLNVRRTVSESLSQWLDCSASCQTCYVDNDSGSYECQPCSSAQSSSISCQLALLAKHARKLDEYLVRNRFVKDTSAQRLVLYIDNKLIGYITWIRYFQKTSSPKSAVLASFKDVGQPKSYQFVLNLGDHQSTKVLYVDDKGIVQETGSTGQSSGVNLASFASIDANSLRSAPFSQSSGLCPLCNIVCSVAGPALMCWLVKTFVSCKGATPLGRAICSGAMALNCSLIPSLGCEAVCEDICPKCSCSPCHSCPAGTTRCVPLNCNDQCKKCDPQTGSCVNIDPCEPCPPGKQPCGGACYIPGEEQCCNDRKMRIDRVCCDEFDCPANNFCGLGRTCCDERQPPNLRPAACRP